MKQLLMILALSLPLNVMAQEAESKDKSKDKKDIRQHDMRDWDRGDMRRNMAQRQNRQKMAKKHKIRQAVRFVVVGGVAYYIGYHQGQHNKHGYGMKRKPYMGASK